MNAELEFWKIKLIEYRKKQKQEYNFFNECSINSIKERIEQIESELKNET